MEVEIVELINQRSIEMKKVIRSLMVFMLSCMLGTLVHADTVQKLEPKKPKVPPNYTISITNPTSEQTFQNDVQDFSVSVDIKPELEKEDSVIVLVDGKEVGDPAHAPSVSVPRLDRGSHTLQAKIIQPKGKGATSETITIYQQRASVKMPKN